MEENSQALATESFSYSWLTNKPSFPSDEHANIYSNEDSFQFDVPAVTSAASTDVVNADDIFSHGRIMPAAKALTAAVSRVPFVERYRFLRKWRRSSKKVLHKWLGFVTPLGWPSRKCSRVDDLQRKVFEVQSFCSSLQTSPRQSSYGLFDANENCKRSIEK